MDKDKLLMCRICMIEDVDMHYVVSDNVQETYEVLTRMTFATKKCRPLQICYTCYARLENCYHLRALCLQTEELFTEILDKNGFPNNDGININNDDTYFGNDGTVDDTINAFVPIQNVPIKIKVIEDGYVENQGAGIENLESKVVPNTGLVKSEDDITIETDEDFVKEENETVFEPSQLNKEEIKEQREEHSEVKDARTHNKLQLDKLEDHAPSFSYGELDMEVTYNTDKNTVEQIQSTLNSNKQQLDKLEDHTASISSGELDMEVTCETNKNTVKQIPSTSENSLNIEYKCDICKKEVHKWGDLLNHSHKGRKPYKCEKCGKKFLRKSRFAIHIRRHTGEKPYQCDICKKYFSCQGYLNSHMRIHIGEKPHKCDICEKCFISRNDLIKHFRSHTGEKPYQCSKCQKRFVYDSNLLRHMRIHTGEKSYKCDICEKCFREKCHLIAHIRTHNGNKPYQCKVCEKSFRQVGHLISHTRTHTATKEVCIYVHKSNVNSFYL